MNKTQKGAWAGLVLVVFLLYIPAVDLVEKSLGLLLTHVVAYSVGLPLLILVIYLIRKIDTGPGVKFERVRQYCLIYCHLQREKEKNL